MNYIFIDFVYKGSDITWMLKIIEANCFSLFKI